MSDLELPAEWWNLDANTKDPADAHTVWCFTSVRGDLRETDALSIARDELLNYTAGHQDRLLREQGRMSRRVDSDHPDFPRAMEWVISYVRERYSHLLPGVIDDAATDGVIRSHGVPMTVACAVFVEAKVKA